MRRIRALLYPGLTPASHIQQERTARFPAQPISALVSSVYRPMCLLGLISTMAFLRSSSVYCITKDQIEEKNRIAFSAICLVTSTVSAFGACTQLRAWYEEIRNECSRRPIPLLNHRILFHLALADLLACIGEFIFWLIFTKRCLYS